MGTTRERAVSVSVTKLPGTSHWEIQLASVLAFQEERERGDRLADEWSRELDVLGAPPD
jgi:hypothetical protein